MPTTRVYSLKPAYDQLNGQRGRFARSLRATVSNALHEPMEGVEAFWLQPIDPDDAVNTVDIWLDVEYSQDLDERKLAELVSSIFWLFTDDPTLSLLIPYATTIGIWLKTPGQFEWRETTHRAPTTVDQLSQFPFFDGEKLIKVMAPDHPKAPFDERHQEHFWYISVEDQYGEEHATRGARADNPGQIWSEVDSAAHQAISSSAVDERIPEIREWLDQVYAAYQTRISSAPPA